jgi:hypothetical protein
MVVLFYKTIVVILIYVLAIHNVHILIDIFSVCYFVHTLCLYYLYLSVSIVVCDCQQVVF